MFVNTPLFETRMFLLIINYDNHAGTNILRYSLNEKQIFTFKSYGHMINTSLIKWDYTEYRWYSFLLTCIFANRSLNVPTMCSVPFGFQI